jgi:Na+/H+-dicarboxylate symporter
MGAISRLLGSLGANSTGTGVIAGESGIVSVVRGYVDVVVTFVLAICALLVILYAIMIGYKLARAEEDGKRKDAKNQLIYAIIGVVGITLIIVMFRWVLPTTFDGMENYTETGEFGEALTEVYNVARAIVTMVLEMIVAAAVIFAVWIGWAFMKAEDDTKRKNAKTQLLYTIIGIVGIVIITVIANMVLSGLSASSVRRES